MTTSAKLRTTARDSKYSTEIHDRPDTALSPDRLSAHILEHNAHGASVMCLMHLATTCYHYFPEYALNVHALDYQ